MRTINVNASKPYMVTIEKGLHNFSYMLCENCKVCIVTDENVAPLYLEAVAKLFRAKVYTVVLEQGEKTKSLDSYVRLVKFLQENGFTRQDVIVALGGGVIGDLSGFLASTYMRGIKYISMPTTLLSMIDSSVGGKTAINFAGAKNLIGCFYQPDYVYVNVDFLKSLSKKQIDNGLGELVKYSLLKKDGPFSIDLNNPQITEEIIYNCLSFKAKIIEDDEFDTAKRTLLNLGHTVGHAIESLSDYTISHGECVFKGLFATLKVSENLYGLNKKTVAEITDYLNSFSLNGDLVFDKNLILNKILQDKKRHGEFINFVCIHGFGDCRVEKLTVQRLGELL